MFRILLLRISKNNGSSTCVIAHLLQMKELPLQQGVPFIKRLKHAHYPSDKNKLWKKSRKALEIVVQVRDFSNKLKQSLLSKSFILEIPLKCV